MATEILSAEYVRTILDYDPLTGVFIWRKALSSRGKVGDKAGRTNVYGYREIRIHGRHYKSHRLAWLYMTGDWPKDRVDHINGVRDDNQWANLRDVSQAVNLQNMRRPRKGSKSGFLGVTRVHGYSDQWRARIFTQGAARHIGVFNTPEEAHAAYLEAKRRLHEGCTI